MERDRKPAIAAGCWSGDKAGVSAAVLTITRAGKAAVPLLLAICETSLGGRL